MELQEPLHETGFQRWRRMFPWLHLLRVPGIAGRMPLMAVGFVTSYLLMTLDVLTVGYTSLDQIPDLPALTDNWLSTYLMFAGPNTSFYLLTGVLLGEEESLFQGNLWLTFIVLAFSGLILCRLSASLLTGGKSVCLEQSLLFAGQKIPSLFLGLLFPVLAITGLYVIVWLSVSIEGIPVAGPWLGGLAYLPSLIATFLILILLFGTVIGWPLLAAAIATENSDGFDAWSRAFDYLRSQLLPIVAGYSLAILLGTVVLATLGELTQLTFLVLDALQANILDLSNETIADRNSHTFAQGPAGFQNLWRTLWACALNGYAITLYWSAVTAVYILARHNVDRIPLTEFDGQSSS